MNRFFIFLVSVLVSLPAFTAEKEAKVLIKTNMGKITVKLYNETPLHRDNFLKLVEQHQYDSIMFHRVIKLFMIQAGEKYPTIHASNAADTTKVAAAKKPDFKIWQLKKKRAYKVDKKLERKQNIVRDPNYKAPDHLLQAEIVPQFFHKRGQLCAARQPDNANPERKSSGMQFYIVTGKHFTDHELNKMEVEKNRTFTPEQRQAYKIEGGAPHLDGDYTIFGEVMKGMKVVQKIELSGTDHFDLPIKDIRIKTMKILKK